MKICEAYGSLCRYPKHCCADYCHRMEYDGSNELHVSDKPIKEGDGEMTKGGNEKKA
jgi:hypothetical protein